MVDGNRLGDVGFQYLGVPYSQMDCQAFVEQCLRDCGMNKNLAGSNAWFREVYNHGAIMTPEECVKELGTVPKGAFLFILEHDGGEPEKYKPDGLGNASHIGIVTEPRGKGAIHSSASRGCVAESEFHNKTIKNGGWNRVGLWDQVSYDYGGDTPEPGPEPEPGPDPEMAVVVAENGKPVNLRTRPSKSAALVDRVPRGEKVEVLEHGDEWSKIRWNRKTGWMMDAFLAFDGEDSDADCTVIISGLTQAEADALKSKYPQAEISHG